MCQFHAKGARLYTVYYSYVKKGGGVEAGRGEGEGVFNETQYLIVFH